MSRGLTVALALGGALLASCTSAVRSGLSEREADGLVLALDDNAIAASKERGAGRAGYEVHVPRADLTRALRVARDSGALEAAQPGFDDLYAEPALVATAAEERARQAFATAGELARSLEALPNVLRARVHLTPPEPRASLDAAAGSSMRAAVLVQRRAGSPAIDESAIRALLSGAAGELPASHLAIVQSERPAPRLAEHARVGPFTVAKRDAPLLRATLTGALALNGGLAVLLIVAVARRRARPATA